MRQKALKFFQHSVVKDLYKRDANTAPIIRELKHGKGPKWSFGLSLHFLGERSQYPGCSGTLGSLEISYHILVTDKEHAFHYFPIKKYFLLISGLIIMHLF